MTKKVLIVATTAYMIRQFNMDNISILQDLKFEVHVAANFEDPSNMDENTLKGFIEILINSKVILHHVAFLRGIGTLKGNIRVLHQLNRIFAENKFEFMHCQSPIGSVLGRIAAHKAKVPAIYMAHGFQFFKGGPKRDWALFYTLERLMSFWTDTLITINTEDYKLAQKKFFSKNIKYVPGVGVDLLKIKKTSANLELKKELKIDENSIVIISAGELNDNKNHKIVLEAINMIDRKDIYYIICGKGENKEKLYEQAESMGLKDQFKILGFRNDLLSVIKMCDLFVFPSKREGLSVALMEALGSDVSVVATDIRGNRDLIENGKNGWLFKSNSASELANKIKTVIAMKKDEKKDILNNQRKKILNFDKLAIHNQMKEIFVSVRKVK